MKEKPKKHQSGTKKTIGKHEKKLVTGQTEVMDFDLEEEIRIWEEQKAARKAARKAAADIEEKGSEAKIESGRNMSDQAVKEEAVPDTQEGLNRTWDKMPEKEVAIGEETMELLGLDSLLDEVYPEAETDFYEDDTVSAGQDYMDFVPKKMNGSKKTAKKASVKTASVKTASVKTASVKTASVKTASAKPAAAKPANKAPNSAAVKSVPRKKSKKGGFLSGMDMMDRIIAATGVLVVLVAVMTAGIYMTAQSAKKQVAAMAEVGMKMETIGIAGEGIFTAVADARFAAQEAAEYAQETINTGEYEEKELTTQVNVGLKLTSVQKDLKIKFTNKNSGKLIGNQPFEVAIEGPEDLTKVDDDEDGIIYISSIKPGEYTVTITAPEEIDGSKVKGVSSIVTVKDKIEYKKIDVADEVKSEAEVNASKEDTVVKAETESVSTDTVEWVESSKTAIGGGVSYVEVSKSDIPDPSASAAAGFMKIAARRPLLGSIAMLTTPAPDGSPSDNDPGDADEPQQPAEPTVESVTISADATEVSVGTNVNLHATVKMTDSTVAYNGDIEWSYDGNSSTGNSLTFTSQEEKSITVTASAGGKSAQCTVHFKAVQQAPKVKSVTVTASPAAPRVGDEITLTAAVAMDDPSASYNGTVSWSGAVSGSGSTVKMTASAKGTVSVTATADGVSGKLDITVSDSVIHVTKVTLDQTTLAMTAGESKALKATVEPADATEKGVTFGSSDEKVATVDANGNVKAVAAGTADITVTTKDGSYKAVCKVTVKAAAAALGVVLEAPGTVNAGEEKQLKWTTTGEVDTAKTTFASSNTSLATVDNAGKVKALAKGSVTITVTVTDKAGKTASANGTLTINPAQSVTISLNPSSASIKVGEKVTINATVTTAGGKGLTWKSGDEAYVKIVSSNDTSCTVEGLKPGTIAVTATSNEKTDVKAVCEVKVTTAADPTGPLRDKNGNQLYIRVGDNYLEAKVADYYLYDKFYRKKDDGQYLYTGWQNLDGKRYYFDKNGVPVTGDQIIQGMQYSFNSDGSLKVTGAFGIDVSKHNGNIDWNAVKNSGVEFVIIRCGYRGSATGVLVEDPKFKTNIQGAIAAGLKVGIYFFSQAVNEVEAVEEASMTLSLINKYKISYPVYIDVEAANGRADGMNAAARTKVIKAYCQTIANSGYTAGIYANKTWLNSMFHVGELGSYKIWLAQYAAAPTYSGRYEMWQYSCTGRIPGISEKVDLNTSYMTY